MEKSLVIKRLRKAIDILENKIKDEEFDYNAFIKEIDFKNSCGTVCCLAGWYPKYAPKSGLEWNVLNPIQDVLVSSKGSCSTFGIDDDLRAYHGLQQIAIDYMFYGDDLRNHIGELILENRNGLQSTRLELAKCIDNLIYILEQGTHDNLLLL